jgi:hypothetical protein
MTNTSTPKQTALPTKWFQTDQMALPSLIVTTEVVASDFEDDIKSLDDGVFSESTNTSRKRKADPNRNIRGAGTQDDIMAKLASAQVSRNKTMAEVAASQKDVNASQQLVHASQQRVHASQDILNRTKAVTDAQGRIKQMRADRRSLIDAIGGKEKLVELRNGESQDSRCDEIDDLEKWIATTKKMLATALEAYENATRRPPASPSA